MKANSIYKIPEGKLVKVFLEFEEEKVVGIKIFGDFFLHPESSIEKIEQGLLGKKFVEKELVDCINEVVKQNGIELFGLSAEGLVKAIFLAKESAENE